MTTTYFITGANRGIGLALATEISANKKNTVIATSRSLKNAKALKDLNRLNLHIIELDIAEPYHTIEKKLKVLDDIAPNGVDVIYQNAGIGTKSDVTSILDPKGDPEEFTKLFETNTLGPLKVYRALFKYWTKKDNGVVKKIAATSSSVGLINNFLPLPGGSYGVSKAALNYVNRQVAFSLANSENPLAKNALFLTIQPGLVKTDMTREFLESDLAKGYPFFTPEESAAKIIERVEKATKENNDTFIDVTLGPVSW